ncbi:MAG: EVE domain-containing protein [Planctomycetota bacterium]
MTRRYWLIKSEPETFSFDDLLASPGRTTPWDGVRNYQARNLMRDDMQVGDGVVFYHSNAKPPGIAGFAEVASEAYPDPTQFDPADAHFDSKSDAAAPRWLLVDIAAVEPARRFVPLDELKAEPALAEMAVVQRGSRLSVQPVTAAEWRTVRRLAGLGPAKKP